LASHHAVLAWRVSLSANVFLGCHTDLLEPFDVCVDELWAVSTRFLALMMSIVIAVVAQAHTGALFDTCRVLLREHHVLIFSC
jgi:hypothetical protein